MSKKKPAMVITIECENKDEVKNVLNLFKDALAAHLPELTKDDSDEPEPEAFRPKEGDICTCIIEDNIDAIFRYSGKKRTDEDGDVWFEGNPGLTCSEDLLKPYMIIYGEDAEYLSGCCRLATEEEIKLFHEKTKNEEKKDADRTPEKAEFFWAVKLAIYAGGIFKAVHYPINMWDSPVFAAEREIGWMFRTKEECQLFCDRLNEAIKNVKP